MGRRDFLFTAVGAALFPEVLLAYTPKEREARRLAITADCERRGRLEAARKNVGVYSDQARLVEAIDADRELLGRITRRYLDVCRSIEEYEVMKRKIDDKDVRAETERIAASVSELLGFKVDAIVPDDKDDLVVEGGRVLFPDGFSIPLDDFKLSGNDLKKDEHPGRYIKGRVIFSKKSFTAPSELSRSYTAPLFQSLYAHEEGHHAAHITGAAEVFSGAIIEGMATCLQEVIMNEYGGDFAVKGAYAVVRELCRMFNQLYWTKQHFPPWWHMYDAQTTGILPSGRLPDDSPEIRHAVGTALIKILQEKEYAKFVRGQEAYYRDNPTAKKPKVSRRQKTDTYNNIGSGLLRDLFKLRTATLDSYLRI